ncbi:HetZ-related protein 2 [Aphanothece sacrum]|uniref:Bacterial regulatory s, luxR family protein n=1 Tax=Aphanothece sacrum FPU1 TaxID=1920663 RepID=A0A401IKP2_APHSA|nr:HetZ-related protein 2 [Aphanothece sacrum]GBF81761.1 bacterial regulatory s, luxR family protein [Aphanothece sacrum FPU1]GBF85119.1 bacterial regulatory s, luxR family protein [Aphanothece sacrum FPU3]
MTNIVDQLKQNWHTRLLENEITQNQDVRDSIINWLLGEDTTEWETFTPEKLMLLQQGMEYRYRVLQQRYIGKSPTQAYRNLMNRLGSVTVLRNKIRTWISLSRDRQRAVTDVLQDIIQEMLHSDHYIQSQITWISQCTSDERLRNSLLLTIIEEYCLRPVRNQPLLVYRFVNYLRRSQKGGMTQVPQKQNVHLISEEIITNESDNSFSLLDSQAVADYEEAQQWEEKKVLRQNVKEEFETYLAKKLGQEAVEWLKLYLQGQTQEAIAEALKMPIKTIYRLREKVGYHAIQVFALKENPELVANWLEISLKEHNLGLTLQQWQIFRQELSTEQKQILDYLKENQSLEEIAKSMNWKKTQIMNEWRQIYLKAQSLRSNV